jgi:hypothetical protein
VFESPDCLDGDDTPDPSVMHLCELRTITQHGQDHLRRIKWWPGTLALRSPAPAVIEHVRNHVLSSRAVDARCESRQSIYAVPDQRATSRLHAALRAHATEPFFAYAGDHWEVGEIAGLRSWARCTPAVGPVVVELGPHSYFLAGPEPHLVALATLRLAREILRTELALAGAVTVHASLAAGQSLGGTLFLGPSGSGKTTLALALARSGILASGDQTEILSCASSGPVGHSFPWAVTVSHHGLESAGLDFDHRGRQPRRQMPAGKYRFTLLEISEILGLPVATELVVETVVLIQPALSASRPVARVTDLTTSADQLRREMREPDPAFPSFWLATEPIHTPRFSDLVAKLRGLRIVHLSWNPARHRATHALQAIGACK